MIIRHSMILSPINDEKNIFQCPSKYGFASELMFFSQIFIILWFEKFPFVIYLWNRKCLYILIHFIDAEIITVYKEYPNKFFIANADQFLQAPFVQDRISAIVSPIIYQAGLCRKIRCQLCPMRILLDFTPFRFLFLKINELKFQHIFIYF